MFSTENRFSTGYQSPPRPPSQRLPRVAAGSQHDDDDHNMILSGAGSTLTTRPLGLKDGVHLRLQRELGLVPVHFPSEVPSTV